MRWVYMAVTAVLALVTLVFAVQNLHSVTISFLGLSLSAPLALLVAVIYLLGMATGGSLWALTRWAVEGARQQDRPA
jgi:uncharacterized integral membrane protein